MYKLRHFIYLVILIAFDQYTKFLARTELAVRHTISLLPDVLSLHYHENDGAVWGILSGKVPWLIAFTVIVLGIMLAFYLRLPKIGRFEPLRLIMVFIAAGAVGNLIDRIFFGYVTDFIYIELINFPIFNIADCYITLSAVVLLLLTFFYYREEDFDFLSAKKKSIRRDESGNDGLEESCAKAVHTDIGLSADTGAAESGSANTDAAESGFTDTTLPTGAAAPSHQNAARVLTPEMANRRKDLSPEFDTLEKDDDNDDEG